MSYQENSNPNICKKQEETIMQLFINKLMSEIQYQSENLSRIRTLDYKLTRPLDGDVKNGEDPTPDCIMRKLEQMVDELATYNRAISIHISNIEKVI